MKKQEQTVLLLGSRERANRLQTLWNSVEYELQTHAWHVFEEFRKKAKEEGFADEEIRYFLKL